MSFWNWSLQRLLLWRMTVQVRAQELEVIYWPMAPSNSFNSAFLCPKLCFVISVNKFAMVTDNLCFPSTLLSNVGDFTHDKGYQQNWNIEGNRGKTISKYEKKCNEQSGHITRCRLTTGSRPTLPQCGREGLVLCSLHFRDAKRLWIFKLKRNCHMVS